MKNAALYVGAGYHGEPFCPNGNLDLDAIKLAARWPIVVLDAPVVHRADLRAEFRTANPAIRLIAKTWGNEIYFNPYHSIDPALDIRKAIYDAVASAPDGRGFLWSSVYGDWFNPAYPAADPPRPNPGHWSCYNANWACQDAVDAVAAVIIDRILHAGLHGWSADWSQHELSSASEGTNTDHIDLDRAGGFKSLGDFDRAFAAGQRSLCRQIRRAAGSDFTISLNDGGTHDLVLDGQGIGSMREGFPGQAGGSWLTNMLGYIDARGVTRRGLLAECTALGAGALNWINMQPARMKMDGSPNPKLWDAADPANARAIRFGLGSAMLAGAAYSMSTNNTPSTDRAWECWAPEYDLDFGNALHPAVAYPSTWGTWRRDFERGTVLVNPTPSPQAIPLGIKLVQVAASDAAFVPK